MQYHCPLCRAQEASRPSESAIEQARKEYQRLLDGLPRMPRAVLPKLIDEGTKDY